LIQELNFKMSIIIKKVINFCYYRPIASLGLFILIFFTFVGIFAPLIAPYGPIEMIVKDRLSPPSLEHWMGTDHLGMDIFSRVVYSTRIDLFIAVTSVSLAIVIGVPLGALIGYAPKKVDEIVMRLIDGINAFPMFILALIVAAAIGPGLKNVIFVVAFVNFPSYLRLVRGQVLSIKEMQFIEAAESVGNGYLRIAMLHILPNTLGPVLVLACLNSAWAILTAAGLSFLGVGIPLPQPEWGAMVSAGTRYALSGEWWIAFFPGLIITIVVLSLNLIADTLQEILDPKRKVRV
tara:strand:- start:1394 stop:2269 length:876 start_codon:yes stop_codon:yes gene_type:complete